MTTEDLLNADKTFNIREFEVGDKIVRVERAPFKTTVYNENLGVETEITKHSDGSYIGEEMEFLGVFNRMICLKKVNPQFDFEKDAVKLHIDQWQDGWQKYNIPQF